MGYPTQEQIDQWHNDPNNWKWGLFYYNKEDSRVLVSKKVEWMGTTFNFANPKSLWIFLATVVFFGFIVFMIEYNN